ncbi:MAG TPA: hypothetical protein DCR24_09900 [Bacillus bacterium]|nr:hypothetical protein [Bacillus sp. (in: firmicutes)]
MKTYEHAFNENEWFIIGTLLVLHLALWLAPRIFSKLEAIGYYFFGVNTVLFFDHTISVKPWDFYDVNDNSSFQFTDFISYITYGPYSYFFVYFYVKLRISGIRTIFYIVIWSAFSLLMEWIGVKIGMLHYDKGYKMYWSFPIYLGVQSMLVIFYHLVKKKQNS